MLNGIWGRVKQPFVQMRESYEAAPPTNRKFDEGYVLLANDKGPVGAFSAELYVMAQANRLACQIKEQQMDKFITFTSEQARIDYMKMDEEALYKALYRADGTRKTVFELAILPATKFTDIEKLFKKAAGLKSGNKVKLPAPVNKYRILPDWLPHLNEMGLTLYSTEKLAAVDDVKVNIRNPKKHTSTFERAMHYGSQWMAWFLALSVGLETALAVGFTFPWMVLPFALGYLAHKCAKDFMLFDVIEYTLRDLGWMFDKEYAWKGQFSRRKAMETSIYLTGIGLAVYLGVTSAYTATLGLSTWSALTAVGVSAGLVSGLAMLAAGSFALTAGLGIWLGLSYSTRYFWQFSFYDTAIKPTPELKAAVDALPVVNNGPEFGVVPSYHNVNEHDDIHEELGGVPMVVVNQFEQQCESDAQQPLRSCCAGNQANANTMRLDEDGALRRRTMQQQ